MPVVVLRWTVFFVLAFGWSFDAGPVLAGGTTTTVDLNTVGQDAATTAEQQLVDKYAPIVGLKDQEAPCDESGEPFYPVSVDVVLDRADVTLKRNTGSSSSQDEVMMTAPGETDLYAKGEGYYLDLPGNPREPGCTYETWFDANSDGYEPTTYAHIVANGTNQLALQYWFYYVFNNFNNTHESDWEMIQIVFEVGTAEEALQVDPVSIAMAQHGGGETAGWTDAKLQRDGTHPVVYAAAGSHATQYGQAVYLGWGENGTGFGCDITTGPTTLVPLTPLLLPETQPDPNEDYAWLNFVGRWGERQEGEFNGPTGPSTKTSWKSPFVWQAGLRDSSIEVPLANTFGPAPTEVFCTLSTWGSSLFRVIGDSPALFLTVVVAIVALTVSMVRYVWPTIRVAAGIYRRQIRLFLLIGLLLIPVGILFNGFQYLAVNYPPGSTVVDLTGKSPGSYYAMALLTLIGQLLASLLVVGPMVIETYDAVEKGKPSGFRDVYRASLRHLPGLAKSVGLLALVVVGLSITLIGVPIAIWLLVRWMFVSQATVLDDVGTREALELSSRSVQGRWWRVGIVATCLTVLGAAPGVLVGLGLLVFGSASVQTTNVVSSLIYVITVPLTILGLTAVYRSRDLTSPMFPFLRRLIGRGKSEPAAETDPALAN